MKYWIDESWWESVYVDETGRVLATITKEMGSNHWSTFNGEYISEEKAKAFIEKYFEDKQ